MSRDFPPFVLVLVIGAVGAGVLYLEFAAAWEVLYAPGGWGGFRRAFQTGVFDPWREVAIRRTDASLGPAGTTQMIFAGLAVGLGLLKGREELETGLALWFGALIPVLPLLVVRGILGGSDLMAYGPGAGEPIVAVALLAEPVRLGAAAFGGTAVAGTLRMLVGLATGRA